jgi:hypothetical protein
MIDITKPQDETAVRLGGNDLLIPIGRGLHARAYATESRSLIVPRESGR